MRFTDTFIRHLKPAEKKFYRREVDGFTIRVMPSGAKTWLYIYTLGGKRKELNLGSYPDVTLAAAHDKHIDARRLVGKGIDPAAAASEEEETRRRAPTMTDLADDYMKKHSRPNKKTWQKDEYCLDKDVLPILGSSKAEDIRRRDIVLLLESIIERGAPGQARNVFEVLRRMFSFALERDILEFNPCTGVRVLPQKSSRDRVLTASEIKTFWQELDNTGMSEEIKRALRLILVTGARPGEVIGMHAREINGDWWEIPAKRSKNSLPHRVFLTKTAKQLIGKPAGYAFPSPRPGEDDKETPIEENAIAHVLRRNLKGYTRQRAARAKADSSTAAKAETAEDKKLELAHFTPHDLRRTCATQMAEMGQSNEVIDAILGHKTRGIVAVYNRHDYAKEKQAALAGWEKRLKTITKPREKAAKVASSKQSPAKASER